MVVIRPSFECQVCTSTFVDSKQFICPSCSYSVCKGCQKMYMLPSCMSCRAEFTQKHMLDSLGAVYVNTVLRRHQEKMLMDREKALLPAMQDRVDDVRAQRENTALARFGTVQRLQPRLPRIQEQPVTFGTPTILRCPVDDCRGFVDTATSNPWACGVCKVLVCRDCHVVCESYAEHACNPDDLTSIALLQTDSRSCPQCRVSIFKAEGCNHMHCTFCGVDFHWETGKRMVTTTNHHYNGVANISQSVAQSASFCTDEHNEHDQELNVIPKDALNPRVASAEFTASLYDDLSVVRFTRGALFRDTGSYEASLTDLRVKFLMGELEEARWTRRVFAITKSRLRCEHLTRVLDMYIATARDHQRLLFRCQTREESIVLEASWVAFINICNQSFVSLQSEFGGSLLVLRDRLDDPNQHPLLFQ